MPKSAASCTLQMSSTKTSTDKKNSIFHPKNPLLQIHTFHRKSPIFRRKSPTYCIKETFPLQKKLLLKAP